MRCLIPFLAAACALSPLIAHAGRGSVGLVLEPGTASISPPAEESRWGLLGGASIGVGLSKLLWVQAYFDAKRIAGREPATDVTAIGASLRQDLDLLALRPYAEVGLSRVSVTDARGSFPAELVPVLGFGVDVVSFGWLLWGAVMRYYPLFGSQLEYAPAYLTLNARLGVVLGYGL